MGDLTRLPRAMSMLRDMISCNDYPDVAAQFGVLPASADVEAAEHRDSHVRCEALLPCVEPLLEAATEAGMIIHALADADPDDLPQHVDVAQRTVVGVVARLIDAGYLEVVR